ncbi:MAG: hypothetical protein LBJ00_06920 [Planctomycetaceae bacterium]|nr:hypothetical protein [Planctomycetaceae bacterium]
MKRLFRGEASRPTGYGINSTEKQKNENNPKVNRIFFVTIRSNDLIYFVTIQ